MKPANLPSSGETVTVFSKAAEIRPSGRLRSMVRWVANKAQQFACFHAFGPWERETYAIMAMYGRTDGHVRQVRRCAKCGWHEQSDLT